MKQVSVTELKRRLSQYLRMVKRGASLEIVERSIPIARMTSMRGSAGGANERLERLIHEGVITRARGRASRKTLSFEPIRCNGDAARALTESRGDR